MSRIMSQFFRTMRKSKKLIHDLDLKFTFAAKLCPKICLIMVNYRPILDTHRDRTDPLRELKSPTTLEPFSLRIHFLHRVNANLKKRETSK